MDRIADMTKLLTRPDVTEQHQRIATERHGKAKAANDLYTLRHGVAKRSAASRHQDSKGVYADRVLRQGYLGQPCQRCRGTDRLEVCHIVPVEVERDDSPANIMWLCHECHTLAHGIMAGYELQSCWDLT